MNNLRKSSGIAAVVALAAAGLVGVGLATPAIAGKETAKLVPTKFGLEASGYASKLHGGQAPTGSDKAAYSVVACTNKAGVENDNAEAAGDLGNGLAFHGASTHAWTTKNGQAVSAWSRHKINKITLVGSPLGDVNLKALVSTSHAWHDASGYHGHSASSLGAIEFDPVVGEPQDFPVPSPGQSVTIPGVAEIGLGIGTDKSGHAEAATNINALRVKVLLSSTNTWIGHTHADISGAVKTDLFSGSAYASKLSLLDGLAASGRTVPTSVPCVGTNGNWTTNHLNDTDLSGSLLASGLTSRQQSGFTGPGRRPEVTAIARVGRVDLGAGLEVQAVRARAHTVKTASGYALDTHGTSIGGITYNGEEQEFPVDQDVMEIPGVARFERAIVTRGPRGIAVTALRVTLLDGTGADTVLDLGNAKAALQPSGL
jgi:hypothetical protein